MIQTKIISVFRFFPLFDACFLLLNRGSYDLIMRLVTPYNDADFISFISLVEKTNNLFICDSDGLLLLKSAGISMEIDLISPGQSALTLV